VSGTNKGMMVILGDFSKTTGTGGGPRGQSMDRKKTKANTNNLTLLY